MSDYQTVAKLSELPDGGKLTVEIDERLVVLVRVGEEVFCIDDVCTHDGGPLGDGCVIGHAIACPRHGAQFDLATGKALTMPATEDSVAHEVRLAGAEIQVKLNSPQ